MDVPVSACSASAYYALHDRRLWRAEEGDPASPTSAQSPISIAVDTNGGLVARTPLHDAMEGLDPSSACCTCSSPGERSPTRPTVELPLLALGALTTHIEASDLDLCVRTPRCSPLRAVITRARGTPQHFHRRRAGERKLAGTLTQSSAAARSCPAVKMVHQRRTRQPSARWP